VTREHCLAHRNETISSEIQRWIQILQNCFVGVTAGQQLLNFFIIRSVKLVRTYHAVLTKNVFSQETYFHCFSGANLFTSNITWGQGRLLYWLPICCVAPLHSNMIPGQIIPLSCTASPQMIIVFHSAMHLLGLHIKTVTCFTSTWLSLLNFVTHHVGFLSFLCSNRMPNKNPKTSVNPWFNGHNSLRLPRYSPVNGLIVWSWCSAVLLLLTSFQRHYCS
jgi:hypothetical protein